MINFILRLFWIWRFKRLYARIQKRAERVLKSRDETIRLNKKFHEYIGTLKKYGVKNPKEIVLGKRPPTGKIK